MNRILGVLIVLAVVGGSQPGRAEPPGGGPFGLGIIVGEPTGVTGKYWFNRESALDFDLGWEFYDYSVSIYVDYLYHFLYINESRPRADMPLYVGGGAKIGFHDHDHAYHHHHHHDGDVILGVRVPFGIGFLFNRLPFEVFIEIAPGLILIPGAYFDIDGAFGFRYYF